MGVAEAIVREPESARVPALPSTVTRTVELAAACGAPPAMQLAVALAAQAPDSVSEALSFLESSGRDILSRGRGAEGLRSLAELEPHLRCSPELARVRPDVGDHELRGRLVFQDLVGQRSFFQVAALAIGGVELAPRDAELLEHLGVNTQLLDVGIWPLNVTRRVAARSGFLHATVAGLATLLNPNMAVRPVGGFMEFLDRLETGTSRGQSVEDQLADAIARRERIPGLGRPVLGPDERNPQVIQLVHRFDREGGTSWKLAWEVDEYFRAAKKLRVNSAGLQGAVMRDMGFSAPAAVALCVLYFIVPVLAHAVFAEEQIAHDRVAKKHGRQ